MKAIQAVIFSALVFGVCADDFRVAADGGRAEIQQSIDAAAAAGGGRVVVTPGVHPIGTLRLKSHVELHLEEGAVLLGSTNRADYEEFPVEVCSVSPGNDKCSLVMAWDAEGIAITGKGTIDGQGPAFYDRRPPRGHWPKPKSGFRPHMIRFIRCRGVRLEGVTFRDSPHWTMFIRSKSKSWETLNQSVPK